MSQGNQEQTLSQENGDKFRIALQLRTITIHDVQKEITTQIEQLIPTKYCKSSEKVCPAGPPRYPGLTGAKGPRGRRTPIGKKGPQCPMGPPGKSEKTEMTGPAPPREEKGGTRPKGMPGATGGPGKTGKTGPKKSRGEKKDMREPKLKLMPGPTESPGKSLCRY